MTETVGGMLSVPATSGVSYVIQPSILQNDSTFLQAEPTSLGELDWLIFPLTDIFILLHRARELPLKPE